MHNRHHQREMLVNREWPFNIHHLMLACLGTGVTEVEEGKGEMKCGLVSVAMVGRITMERGEESSNRNKYFGFESDP